jgi:hypothetical protein
MIVGLTRIVMLESTAFHGCFSAATQLSTERRIGAVPARWLP